MILFYPIFLILPYVFYLLEIFFPSPHLIEELGKLVLVYFILKEERKEKKDFSPIILFGSLLFSFSESFFYLEKIFLSSDFFLYIKRLIFTFLIHFLTLVIFYWAGKKHHLIGLFLALVINILIHYFYNFYLVYEF